MRKPTVDYHGLRLKTLFTPQYSHLLLLLCWVGYLVLFFLTENLIPTERCIPVHCALDDIIPFCEVFIIPYVGWYFFIAGSLLYYLLYDVENFKRLQIYIVLLQAIALLIFTFIPTRQDLRPPVLERNNVFTACVEFLYTIDTNTGVCPSLHCAISIGIASVWLKDRSAAAWLKTFIAVFAALICLSTVFLKQHSVIDFVAALPLCLAAEAVVYGSYWKGKLTRRKQIHA
ncbi:MAG: phosphatase PAP2 family protein [Clostridia bacterium]|nr:phosphatase PAP2 family protein [Clostridia bacterium]